LQRTEKTEWGNKEEAPKRKKSQSTSDVSWPAETQQTKRKKVSKQKWQSRLNHDVLVVTIYIACPNPTCLGGRAAV
jgi:hypothetical protein